MARDQQAILIKPWATDAQNRAEPESLGIDREQGWDVRYEQIGGERPERLVFNQLFHELSLFFNELNQTGMLIWDARIDYIANPGGPVSFVRGSDSNMYQAKRASGPNAGIIVNPVEDATSTYWRKL